MCGTLFPSTLITSTLAPPGSTSVTAYEKVVWWVGLGWAAQGKAAGFSETGGEGEVVELAVQCMACAVLGARKVLTTIAIVCTLTTL